MTAVWIAIGAMTLINFTIKASGPVLLAHRELPAVLDRVVRVLAPALLAGLVVVDTLTKGHAIVLDARAVGLGAAAVALFLRLPVVVILVVAAAAAATARAAGFG